MNMFAFVEGAAALRPVAPGRGFGRCLRSGCGCLGWGAFLARKFVQRFEEYIETERFREEVLCAVAQRLLHESVRAQLRHHDDHGTRRCEGGQHSETVELGHHDVEQEEIGVVLFDEGEHFRAVFGDGDDFVVGLVAEEFAETEHQPRVVVCNDDGLFHYDLRLTVYCPLPIRPHDKKGKARLFFFGCGSGG